LSHHEGETFCPTLAVCQPVHFVKKTAEQGT